MFEFSLWHNFHRLEGEDTSSFWKATPLVSISEGIKKASSGNTTVQLMSLRHDNSTAGLSHPFICSVKAKISVNILWPSKNLRLRLNLRSQSIIETPRVSSSPKYCRSHDSFYKKLSLVSSFGIHGLYTMPILLASFLSALQLLLNNTSY